MPAEYERIEPNPTEILVNQDVTFHIRGHGFLIAQPTFKPVLVSHNGSKSNVKGLTIVLDSKESDERLRLVGGTTSAFQSSALGKNITLEVYEPGDRDKPALVCDLCCLIVRE